MALPKYNSSERPFAKPVPFDVFSGSALPLASFPFKEINKLIIISCLIALPVVPLSPLSHRRNFNLDVQKK